MGYETGLRASYVRSNKNFIARFVIVLTVFFVVLGNMTGLVEAADEGKTERVHATRIAMFIPNAKTFWPQVEAFSTAVAEDIGVRLTIHRYNDPFEGVNMVKQELENPKNLPQGILFHNYKNWGQTILELAEKSAVPAFMFNAGPTAKDSFGLPREK